jgi:8-oxo-dGTP pyrophosphatase MutT (NUDIX family)
MSQSSGSKAFDQQVTASIALADNLLRGKDTGHRMELAEDMWIGVGQNQRLKISDRRYTAIAPNGEKLTETWTVAKKGSDGVTIKPVIEANHEKYLVFVFKPQTSIGQWSLEFPSGGAKQLNVNGVKVLETPEQTATRENEEETGFIPGKLEVIMRGMCFAPFILDTNEIVFEATQLTYSTRKPDYAERLTEVHILPIGVVREMLSHNTIKDFRSAAIAADHLLLRQ